VTRITHHGIPREDQGLMLDLEVELGVETLHLAVVEEHMRPWDYLGREPFARPAHLMPSPPGRSDRALVRTPVTLRLDQPEP
jgi:hypothetical protein